MLPGFRGLIYVGRGCKKLKNLSLNECALLTDEALGTVAARCKGLTRVEVNGCHKIGTTGVQSVGKSCL